ncbi:hypothetical protein [Frigoriglobus tundricola]|nr:hypothetical protein [Frigoriglobus tundricola]
MDRPVSATTVEGFIQQLAVQYVGRGYYFFVTGTIKPHKNPAQVDAKLCARYGVGQSKWAKARRRAAGRASHAYIRFERFFVLLCTHGESPFFEDEGERVRDARKSPVRFRGYAVSFRGGHVHVRIDRPRYLELKSYLVGIAVHRTVEDLASEFRRALAFEPYAPVRSQCLCVLRAVNRARAEAGLEDVPRTCLRFRRRVMKPFEPDSGPLIPQGP